MKIHPLLPLLVALTMLAGCRSAESVLAEAPVVADPAPERSSDSAIVEQARIVLLPEGEREWIVDDIAMADPPRVSWSTNEPGQAAVVVDSGAAAAAPVEIAPGLRVLRDGPSVEIAARVCIDMGPLEQIACMPNSREHEALMAVPFKASEIHTALLLAGFEPGHPGRWIYEENKDLRFIAPEGEALEIFVRYQRDGAEVEHSVRRWIESMDGSTPFPPQPWVFGGSEFTENPEALGPGEHYVADMTGSVIGLVTFGDEVIGFSKVFSDQEAVQPLEWQVATEHIAPYESDVTLIIRRAAASR